nr:hypothetical protein [Candidatus Bathyarchaeota archaeon]
MLLSEHLIDKEKPPEGARTFLLYNFHNFDIPTMPLRVNLEFEKEMFEPSNLTLNVDGYPAPCDLINPRPLPGRPYTLRHTSIHRKRGVGCKMGFNPSQRNTSQRGGADLKCRRKN